MNKSKIIIMWMMVILMLYGCNPETSFYTGPAVKVADVTVAEVYVALDTRGNFKITGGLPVVNDAALLLGMDDIDASFEYTVIEAKKQNYMLYILWQDENNQVRRNEYSFDQPFEVTFDKDEWVYRIAKTNDSVVVFILPTKQEVQAKKESNANIARISSDVEEVNMRFTPGYESKNDNTDVVTKIPSSAIVEILDGPKSADGLKWWYVRWNGYEGWVAEKTGSGRTILVFNP
jgi:hypothetical protein